MNFIEFIKLFLKKIEIENEKENKPKDIRIVPEDLMKMFREDK